MYFAVSHRHGFDSQNWNWAKKNVYIFLVSEEMEDIEVADRDENEQSESFSVWQYFSVTDSSEAGLRMLFACIVMGDSVDVVLCDHQCTFCGVLYWANERQEYKHVLQSINKMTRGAQKKMHRKAIA